MKREPAGQLRRLQQARNLVDGLEGFDLLAAIGGLQLPEAARLDEDVPFERTDRLIVRLQRRLQPRAERLEMMAQRPDRFVEVFAKLADLARVLLHRLLLPAVGDGAKQRDERRRARRDDRPAGADGAKLDERRVLLECGAEKHLAG